MATMNSQGTTLRKHQCIPFLDTSKGGTTVAWAQIDKSTVFALNPGPQGDSQDYICYEAPVYEIDHYEPELPQEIVLEAGNEMYDFVFDQLFNLPVGEDAHVPCLICFPPDADNAKKAWKIDNCTLELGEYNTVDRKLSFTLRLGGDITRGTYSIAAQTGVPTFTADT